MEQLYKINGEEIVVQFEETADMVEGISQVLSSGETDLTHGLDWYSQGHTSQPLFSEQEFSSIRDGVSNAVQSLLKKEGINTEGFKLEQYHNYVTDDLHYKVVGQTRDLFPEDFNFDCEAIHARLGNILHTPLTDINPLTGKKLHIIVRINRPQSTDYNPVHKDIYQAYDGRNEIPQFVNFWIPICGVTPKSSLPVASGSHLIQEDKIVRTAAGSVINGNAYRVNSILSWNGSTELQRPKVDYGSVLVFSPHLIHGLASNLENNATRVSLEFRLFKAPVVG